MDKALPVLTPSSPMEETKTKTKRRKLFDEVQLDISDRDKVLTAFIIAALKKEGINSQYEMDTDNLRTYLFHIRFRSDVIPLRFNIQITTTFNILKITHIATFSESLALHSAYPPTFSNIFYEIG